MLQNCLTSIGGETLESDFKAGVLLPVSSGKFPFELQVAMPSQLHVCTPAEMAGQGESWTTIGKVLHAIFALPLSCFCFF